MADEQRRSDDESREQERDETVQDLDVSEEESEDVRGGLNRNRSSKI